MIANHIHEALGQVRTLQALILEKRMFHGYSGIARMIGGALALLGAAALTSTRVPATDPAHLVGWGVVLTLALLVNYCGLMAWVLAVRRRSGRMPWQELAPAFEAVPALAVGAGLSLALVLRGQYDLLFGTWMCLYGLAHLPYRLSLPRPHYWLGGCYLVAGAVLLVWPGVAFTNPWPMGIVFGLGELIGGWIFYGLNREELANTDGFESGSSSDE